MFRQLMIVSVLLAALSQQALASQPGYDTAGDSAYNAGWPQDTSGGFGWSGGWQISTIGGNAFIGDSTTNGLDGDPEGDGDINSPRAAGGRAWGLLGAAATRMFNGPLEIGQTFSVDWDTDTRLWTLSNGSYIALLSPSGFFIREQLPDDGSGNHVAFTVTSSGLEMSVTPYTAGATESDVLFPYTQPIIGVSLVGEASSDPRATTYFNNISITPEPSSAAILLLGGVALVRRRR